VECSYTKGVNESKQLKQFILKFAHFEIGNEYLNCNFMKQIAGI